MIIRKFEVELFHLDLLLLLLLGMYELQMTFHYLDWGIILVLVVDMYE